MASEIAVVDLFAGPGGLGEGFSSFLPSRRTRPFKIALSVECDPSAHGTLQLRAFYRQFGDAPPKEYYAYLRGDIERSALLSRFPKESAAAISETMGTPLTLGNAEHDALIHRQLRKIRRTTENPIVVIGGPPCQAYSLIGRARNKGNRNYKAEDDRRHFLYEEYLKVLDIVKPDVFVMENVKGLLSSSVGGLKVFERILGDLSNPARALGKVRKAPGYNLYSLVPDPSGKYLFGEAGVDFLVRSEQFGVPQARHRVVILGVANRISTCPATLKPAASTPTAYQVLGDFPKLRSGLSKGLDSPEAWYQVIADSAKLLARYSGVAREDMKTVLKKAKSLKQRGQPFQRYTTEKARSDLNRWLRDEHLGGFVNHQSRAHIPEDIRRYFFCSLYAQRNSGVSPRSRDFPSSLSPRHASWHSGSFADRFKVQAKNRASSTITSHISKDGHYYIHYDPSQCRSLTVREAARLQTFPDNYFFEGNRTQQFIQVGNAVPPWLAKQIAAVVYDLLQEC